jgi:hypothetical protein
MAIEDRAEALPQCGDGKSESCSDDDPACDAFLSP